MKYILILIFYLNNGEKVSVVRETCRPEILVEKGCAYDPCVSEKNLPFQCDIKSYKVVKIQINKNYKGRPVSPL